MPLLPAAAAAGSTAAVIAAAASAETVAGGLAQKERAGGEAAPRCALQALETCEGVGTRRKTHVPQTAEPVAPLVPALAADANHWAGACYILAPTRAPALSPAGLCRGGSRTRQAPEPHCVGSPMHVPVRAARATAQLAHTGRVK